MSQNLTRGRIPQFASPASHTRTLSQTPSHTQRPGQTQAAFMDPSEAVNVNINITDDTEPASEEERDENMDEEVPTRVYTSSPTTAATSIQNTSTAPSSAPSLSSSQPPSSLQTPKHQQRTNYYHQQQQPTTSSSSSSSSSSSTSVKPSSSQTLTQTPGSKPKHARHSSMHQLAIASSNATAHRNQTDRKGGQGAADVDHKYQHPPSRPATDRENVNEQDDDEDDEDDEDAGGTEEGDNAQDETSKIYRIVPEMPCELPNKIPWMTFQIAEFPRAYSEKLRMFRNLAILCSFILGAWFAWCASQTNASFMIILTVIHGLSFLATVFFFSRPFLKLWIRFTTCLHPEKLHNVTHMKRNKIDKVVDFKQRNARYFIDGVVLLEFLKIEAQLAGMVCLATTLIVLQPNDKEQDKSVLVYLSNLSAQSQALFWLSGLFTLVFSVILSINTVMSSLCYGLVSPAHSFKEAKEQEEHMRLAQEHLDNVRRHLNQLPEFAFQSHPQFEQMGMTPNQFAYQYGQLPGASVLGLQQKYHSELKYLTNPNLTKPHGTEE